MDRSSDTLHHRYLSISRAIAGQMEFESVLRTVAAELVRLLPHDHLDIALLSRDGREHVAYEVGMHTTWSDLADTPLPVERAPIRSVLTGDEPFLLTEDALVDPRFHFEGALDGPIFAAGLRSRLHVPLRVQGRIIGSFNVSRQAPRCYARADVRVAQDVADLLAPYLHALVRGEQARKAAVAESEARSREEMLRVGALQLTEGMERERQRVGMDLHDQTLADLTRIGRRIARLRSEEPIVRRALAPIEDDLRTCMHELRRIIEDTKPGVLQMFGFTHAVEVLLERSVAGTRPPIECRVDDETRSAPDRLDETVRTSLYRIVQEAVNNAVLHGEPRTIAVVVSMPRGGLRVRIEDDGCGHGERSVHSNGGLSIMRTRAALVSASLAIESGPGRKGTLITVEVPFEPVEPSPPRLEPRVALERALEER